MSKPNWPTHGEKTVSVPLSSRGINKFHSEDDFSPSGEWHGEWKFNNVTNNTNSETTKETMLPDASTCVADQNDELSKDWFIGYVRKTDEESVPISRYMLWLSISDRANIQYSPKIMHARELLFASASRQLLAASCGSLRHNCTSRKNFFAVRSLHRKNFFLLKNPDRKNFFAATSQKEGDIQNSQQDEIFQGNARSNLGS